MKLRLEYPSDGGAIDVEADELETLIDLANKALKVLWGSSARQISLMSLDEADKQFGMNPRGKTGGTR